MIGLQDVLCNIYLYTYYIGENGNAQWFLKLFRYFFKIIWIFFEMKGCDDISDEDHRNTRKTQAQQGRDCHARFAIIMSENMVGMIKSAIKPPCLLQSVYFRNSINVWYLLALVPLFGLRAIPLCCHIYPKFFQSLFGFYSEKCQSILKDDRATSKFLFCRVVFLISAL